MNVWEFLDRAAERRAQIKLARPTDLRLLANVIGCALISGFLGALFALFIIPIPAGNEQIVTYMIGQLSGFAGGIVAYHYTMTAGQKELDEKRAENSGEAIKGLASAVSALAPTTDQSATANAADAVADAATDKADEIKGEP